MVLLRLAQLGPRRKHILALSQRLLQLGEVSAQHVLHARVLHPLEAFLGVHVLVPLAGDEAVALKPARCHDDEDAEGRLAEAEARDDGLAMGSHQGVHHVDVAAVHLAQLGGEGLVAARQLLERLGHRHAQQAPERRVARHAALAVAEDVDGAEVAALAVGRAEVAEEVRVVVVGDGARVVDAERVEGVGEGDAALQERVLGVAEGGVDRGDGGFVAS